MLSGPSKWPFAVRSMSIAGQRFDRLIKMAANDALRGAFKNGRFCKAGEGSRSSSEAPLA
jgi:hypothetical protein